ncbi:MAG TPA: hypothetical protein VGD37_17835 [Kofleriaceae bacterium]|jgi:hypothetical protein
MAAAVVVVAARVVLATQDSIPARALGLSLHRADSQIPSMVAMVVTAQRALPPDQALEASPAVWAGALEAAVAAVVALV